MVVQDRTRLTGLLGGTKVKGLKIVKDETFVGNKQTDPCLTPKRKQNASGVIESESAYLSRGVSAVKEDVHRAVSFQDKGLFPGAFCKVFPDPAGDIQFCAALHADGAGTKSSVAYLMYRESGDPSWFSGLAQDALIMNTDDLLCIGAVNQFYISNTIGRNAHRIDGDCLSALIGGYDAILSRLNQAGIKAIMTGGETADVGDLVQTVICDATVFVRLPRRQVIDASRIRPDLSIIGFSSFGTMKGEKKENSGIGSNGLTAARHVLLHEDYRTRYPESYAQTLSPEQAYCGIWHLEDRLPGSELTLGEALLSPTRTYLPVMKEIFSQIGTDPVLGLIHCTGGGQTKCLSFGHSVRFIKDNLFPTPPLFAAIRDSGQIKDQEMYQVFNMGHRLELYCDSSVVDEILAICRAYELEARIIGRTEPGDGENEVVIKDHGKTFVYRSKKSRG